MRRIQDIALIVFFLAALCLPGLGMALRFDLAPAHKENRTLAPFPPLALSRQAVGSFPEKFKAYFEDHFGFRNTLIRWQAIARVKWLGVSSSRKVILGKDGWLFQPPYDNSLESYRGPRSFTPAQLAQWQRVLETRRAWLAERGVRYIFIVAPEKHTVYPEYLPETFALLKQNSRLDQLIAYLKEHSDIEVLDLRQALQAGKSRERLYQRTDTHWNDLGAFIAYQCIVAELQKSIPGMQPLAESDFELVREQEYGTDLAAQLGLDDVLAEENLSLRPRRRDLEFHEDATRKYFVTERSERGLPRLVMFRDSFANNLIQFLDPHFSRAVYVWNSGFDARLVEAERPDFVIQEVVERYLLGEPPQDALALAD
jgi:hypothetical protein